MWAFHCDERCNRALQRVLNHLVKQTPVRLSAAVSELVKKKYQG